MVRKSNYKYHKQLNKQNLKSGIDRKITITLSSQITGGVMIRGSDIFCQTVNWAGGGIIIGGGGKSRKKKANCMKKENYLNMTF